MSTGSTLPVSRDSEPPNRERRKSARLCAQNSAFVGMNGNSAGINLELHQIFDLSEEGMSFQNSTPLEIGELLEFSVDLSQPETYFQSPGRVIWTNDAGRTGIRFQKTSDGDTARLQQWIATNLSPPVDAQRSVAEEPTPIHSDAEFSYEIPPGDSPSPFHTYVSGLLASEDVKQEVESLAFDMDSALQIVVQRVLSLTRATGAAIALADGTEMVCRATSGPDAPPLGARLQVGSGFSGECIRSGQLLYCEDSEIDELVDRESCRALDIRSLMAAPIRSNEGVIGLVEIFAPDAGAFTNGDKSVLQGMVEIVLDAVQRGVHNVEGAGQSSANEASPQATDDLVRSLAEAHTRLAAPEPEPTVIPRRNVSLSKLLIFGAAIIVVLLGIWLIVSGWRESMPGTRQRAFTEQSKDLNRQASLEGTTLEGLRGMAANGDSLAEFTLGLRYATGSDAPQDYSEAVHWFSAAAEQGHVMAQSTLGAYYWAGRGVPQDFRKAYFWALIAQSAGDEASRARVPFLVSRLNRNELISVQHEVENWMKQHRQSKPTPAKN
jgi:GAF domain/PilZ domain/Sel1 repeat